MKMIYWFKRKYRQVKRVLDYLPIIWKGYDFDYRYAIDLFKHQLIRTSNFMESDRAYAIDSDMRAKRIKTAIELLDKVYDEEYGMEYIDQIKDIYGDNVLDHWFEDAGNNDGSSFLRYEYEKWDNCEEVEQTKNRLFKLSREKQIRSEKLVWEFISHNIRGWWD